jgi:hypothetical protein
LEKTGIMQGERARQITGRYTRAVVARYDETTPAWKQRWKGLVGAMGEALPLYATGRRDLEGIYLELHHRTNGSVQELNNIVTQAADKLIRKRDPAHESITEALLDQSRINLATEIHQRAAFETTRRAARQPSGKREA